MKVAAKVFALGEEADFEALKWQANTTIDKRQNVQLTTEPAFCQAPVSTSSFS